MAALNAQTPRAVFLGSGTRGPFSFQDASGNPIRVRTQSHVVVRRYSSTTDETGTLLVLNTDYSINNTDVDVVTLTLTVAQEVLTSSQRLVVVRIQSIADVISLAQGGDFSGPTLAAAMSILSEQLQEARRDIDRSIKVDWRETTQRNLKIAPTDNRQFLTREIDGSIGQTDEPELAAIDAGYLVAAEKYATGDGATVAFSFTGMGASKPEHLDIYIDGVGGQKWTDYGVVLDDVTTTVTFSEAPPNGYAILFRPRVYPGIEGPPGAPGSMTGPASATADNIPVFDGITGALLKDGGKALPAGAIVGTSDAQTLTNKTLTSPVVNTPTGIVKGDVGLGNVDNTSDATKNAAVATLTNKTLTTPAINGGTVTPSATAAATEPGYLGAPQRIISAADTFVISDVGKCLYHPAADTTARIWTIPANASVAFPIGTVILIENENAAGVITLAITSDTLRWGSSTGSRSIAANGGASLQKVTSTLWRLRGEGIS